ncbi:hypothetical protein OAK45_08050 [Verrucomicrobia bacterium]|nr:hypothetical protein [Verrucomicrobiota bacterium]
MHPAAQTIISKFNELEALREYINRIEFNESLDPEAEVYAPLIGNKDGAATLEVLASYFISEYVQLHAISDAWDYAFNTPNPLSVGARSGKMERIHSSFRKLHAPQNSISSMVTRYCERQLESSIIGLRDSYRYSEGECIDDLLCFVFEQVETRGLLEFLNRDRSSFRQQDYEPQGEGGLESMILEALREMSWQHSHDVVRCMKAYSHSSLGHYHAFCDSEYTVAYDFTLTSTLISEIEKDTHMDMENVFNNYDDPFFEPIDGSEFSGDRLRDIIDGFLNNIRGGDLDSLIDDLLQGGGVNNNHSSGGMINVIPGIGKGSCAPVLVAVSSGAGTSKRGIWGILKQVRTHLIECHPKTKRVVFFCDTWDPKKFENEFQEDLSIFQNVWGVKFVFIMCVGKGATRLPVVL